MVGEYGGTVVVDWGLAKRRDEAGSSRRGASWPRSSASERRRFAGGSAGFERRRVLAALLDRWARNGTVRAVDAAVTRFGFEKGVTLLALVEPLTGVGGHRLPPGMAANRTRQGRVEKHPDQD